MTVSTILAPVEFSERCQGAARYAGSLAGHFHAELVLLHVVAPPESAYNWAEGLAISTVEDFHAGMMARRQVDLDHFLEEELKSVPVRRLLVEGDPALTIESVAAEQKADWIVMPTHGYGPFRRFLLGSVTAKVLHDVACPVWTGPHLPDAPPEASLHRRPMACAVDLGPNSRDLIRWAAAMAAEFESELTLVHAIGEPIGRTGGFYFDTDFQLQLANDARTRVASLLTELKLEAKVHIEFGPVAQAIHRAALALNAGLVVVGRHHGAGLMGRLRTHAYGIVREAPCPVVSL
jgi:nucleotide-binding universal stress UspA family protein